MKTFKIIINSTIGIIFVSAVILFIYAVFCKGLKGDAYAGNLSSMMYNEGWDVIDEDGNVTSDITLPTNVKGEAGHMVTLHNTLPSDIKNGMSLAYRSSMQDLEILIDGELRGSYTLAGFDHDFGYPPSDYLFVDLCEDDAEKPVDICITPCSGSRVNLNIVEYSYGANVWFGHIRNNIIIVFVAITLILISIVAIAVFSFLHKKVDVGSAFIYLSRLIIVISFWILSESKLRQFIFGSAYLTTILAYLFVEMIAVYAVLFVDELQDHHYQRVFTVIAAVCTIQIVINSILNFTGLVYYYNTLLFSHIWSAVAIIVVVITLILDIRSGRIQRYKIAAYGLGAVTVCAITEMIFFYTSSRRILGLPIGLGLLILIGTTLSQTVTDILALKQQKDENEMAVRVANEANRAKSEFLAQMSHEIRTPINAVLGMNEMVLREAKDPAILDYASNAYNAGKALLSIINDILDISKIEAGKLEIVDAEYELYSLVSDCWHMTADRARKKGLEFVYRVDETLPAKLSGDMFHIRQIVVNFLTNAIKYTDEGRVILEFTQRNQDDHFALEISVKDTGIGLTEENMEKLFTSFQRFDLKHNQSIEGTGLGLSICKQLASLMGGSVEANSIYGKGSVFTCVIPQKVVDRLPVGKVELEQRFDTESIKTVRSFIAKDARILVVDDVEMNLVVFRSLLKGHKLVIDEATSGRQCLDMVKKEKYDLIFMDHMMPEMDGVETFARMKDMEHLNHDTPVIMLTANAISGEREKYLDAGFTAYLTKPIQSERLENLLFENLPGDKIEFVADDEATYGEEEGGNEHIDARRDIAGDIADISGISSELIDVNLGLSYAGGDKKSYFIILENYVGNGKAGLENIRKLCDEENWSDYTTKVHALKSTSLTIGAKELSEAAKELEAAGKEGDFDKIKAKNGILLEMYRSVLSDGEKILGGENDDTSDEGKDDTSHPAAQFEEISKEELSEYIDRIRSAAAGFDSDEIVAACDEMSAYSFEGMPLGEMFEGVQKAANDFDCDRADVLTGQIVSGLGL